MIQRLANPLGYCQLEQMFGVSQGSVTHFTKQFIEAILDTLQHYYHHLYQSNPHTLWVFV